MNLGDDYTDLTERQWPDFLLAICIHYLKQIVLGWGKDITLPEKMGSFSDNTIFEDDCE